MIDKRVQWVAQELKAQLVDQGYIVYMHTSSTGSVYITTDLGLGAKIRISNHNSSKVNTGLNIFVQPEIPKDGREGMYFKLCRGDDLIDNILISVASYRTEVEKKIGYRKYTKILNVRGLSSSVVYRDLLELCELQGRKIYKSILKEKIKSNKDMKTFRNSKFFYK